MNVSIGTIPEMLRNLPQWVVWRYGIRGGKKTKIPYTLTGSPASSTDPGTWTSFTKVIAGSNGYNGIGFVFTEIYGELVGIDLDKCRNPETGIIEPWAKDIIRELNSYTEISVSGAGLHIIIKGKLPPGGNRKGNVELYDRARYFCMTGNHLENTPVTIEYRQNELDALHGRIFGQEKPQPEQRQSIPCSLNDEEILSKARNASNGAKFRALYDAGEIGGYASHSEADSALCMMLAFYCGKDPPVIDRLFRHSALMREKWDRRRADSTYGSDTIRRACEQVSDTYQPAEEPEKRESKSNAKPESETLTVENFYAYMPMHSYIYIPARELWPASSVNSRVFTVDSKGKQTPANRWLDMNRPVEQMSWAPGLPMIIPDRLISEGGWIDHRGVNCFNLYRPPQIAHGDPKAALEWIAHVNRLYPEDADHIIRWLAHRVQRPQEKINHALVLGGAQGIGKDTLLEPVKYAVGPWNFAEVSPTHLLERFNGFVKSVILRISEARDLGEMNRFAFYEHIKLYTAAPPDVIACDEKHIRRYAVPNLCGVVITTNHKTDGIYLPADDRRHYVAWSDLTKEDFKPDYWINLYQWYEDGGYGHVAAFLREDVDLANFNPKAPPPKTDAFWAIVDASKAPEDSELSDAIDLLGNPDAITISDIIPHVEPDFASWLTNRGNARQVPHRLEAVGYEAVRNPGAEDGRWKVAGKRQVVYTKQSLCVRDRITAARALLRGAW